MKHEFMNKKNGKTASVLAVYLDDGGHIQTDSYDRVEDLMADYGAYERQSAEPLIKDEQIRKIIRAWAEKNDSTRIEYVAPENELVDSYGNTISFDLIFKELNHGAEYTIAELCGEDEDEA